MKPDFDLIRQILLDVENLPPGHTMKTFKYPGYKSQLVDWHIDLLDREYFINVHTIKVSGGHVQYEIKSLKEKGRDFITEVKEPSRWNKIKEKYIKPGVSLSLTFLLDLLKEKAKECL